MRRMTNTWGYGVGLTAVAMSFACGGDDTPIDTDLGTGDATMTMTATVTAGDGDSAGDGDGTTATGDGDGTSTGDGDGTTTGDGDGTTGDGDGTTGDGDGTSGDGTSGDGTSGDGTTGDGDGTTTGDGTTGDGDGTSGDGDGAPCGNGVLDFGEECDDGPLNNDLSGPCRTNCTMCECQGTNVFGVGCSDVGMTCGTLGCNGCTYDTSQCSNVAIPTYTGPAAPAFSEQSCWLPCAGYTDTSAPGEVPTAWGAGCDMTAYSKVRIACGIDPSVYRYVDIDKNVFLFSLTGNPELGLLSNAQDQAGTPFTLAANEVYAEGVPPFVPTDTSWFGGAIDCNEASASLTINNELCAWEVANCFGQSIAVNRTLWVYVSP